MGASDKGVFFKRGEDGKRVLRKRVKYPLCGAAITVGVTAGVVVIAGAVLVCPPMLLGACAPCFTGCSLGRPTTKD